MIASTVARERAWRGTLRMRIRGLAMRVDMLVPPRENINNILTFSQKGTTAMSALSLLRSLFIYQAWANGELLEKLDQLDPHAHANERHAAIRLLNHNLVVSKIF